MNDVLSLNTLPEYVLSGFRYFDKHEKHVTRYCKDDVLLLMFDGILRFHEEGKPIALSQNQFYIQKRGLLQEGIEESSQPQYYFIHFYGDFSPDKKTLPLSGTADISALMPYFQELDLLQAMNASKVDISSVFFKILSELAKSQTPSAQRTLVEEVLSYVFQDLKRPVSLDEIAAEVGYCKNHIIKLFQKETGKTPYTYITEQRLNAAKQLLLNSNFSLEQISTDCGFGTYINFYKSFIKTEKIPPSEWKRRQQQRC